jgi:hypothetical protein
MLRMMSSKLLEAAMPRRHDAVHDVIKAAGGRLLQLSRCWPERHHSCWRLHHQDNMMLLMTSSKLLLAAFPSCHDAGMRSSKLLKAALSRCHDAVHDVIKAAAGRLPQLS